MLTSSKGDLIRKNIRGSSTFAGSNIEYAPSNTSELGNLTYVGYSEMLQNNVMIEDGTKVGFILESIMLSALQPDSERNALCVGWS